MKKILLLLALCPFRLWAQTCQYLAYDGFNYAQNMPLDNQYGGVGWAAPWEVQNDDVTIPGIMGATTSPMVWGDLLSFGNYIMGGSNYLTLGRSLNLDNTGPFAAYLNGNGRVGQAGTTLFMSVLLRKEYDNDQISAAMLQGGNGVPWVTNQDPRAVVGYFGPASENAGVKYWSLAVNSVVYRSSVPINIGATTLLVMRIEFGSGSHTVSFWVDPSSIGATMPAPNLSQTITGLLEFNAMAAYLGNVSGQVSMDEVRLGSSYECVTPDNTTPINIPPDAAFTTNPTGGIAPLQINFDGSASVDPDGSLQNYIWIFGDGARDTTTTPMVSHTYSDLGQMTPTLTVTDNDGLQHTAYGAILMTNANGNYPCLASVTAISKATCGQSDGSFLVNAGGANHALYNAGNELVPPSSNPNIYNELAVGPYTLYVSSPDGCRDTFFVHVQTDSTTCGTWTAPACLNMGINLDYVNYYDNQRIFKNFRMDAGDWITYNVSSPTPWTPWNTGVYAEIPMDANGYPLQIPFTTSIGEQGVRLIFSTGGHLPLGDYTFWYDGEGTITLNGATVNANQAGRIDFTVTSPTTNVWVDISTSTLGNHVRNIRILRPGDEATYLSQPFYQGFLDKIAPFHTIRFVEATNTNSGFYFPENWSERPDDNYYTHGGYRGMSYEMIIQLANATQKNVWINIPHSATNDYMQQMAILFRDNLNPNLRIYIEYSNEVWNWQFVQAHYVSDNGPQNISYPRRYAERCRNAFGIWTQVFAGQTQRLGRVLNTQLGNPWYGEQVLAQLRPTEYDYLAPTWYFGYSGSPCAQGFNASTTPEEIIECTRQFFRANYPTMRQDYLTASLFGKQVVNYEGGQHMTDAGATTPYTQAVYAAQLHPDLNTLYQEVLDSLKRLGPVMSNAYNLARRLENVFGSFGHLTDVDLVPSMANAPKWMAVMSNICTAPIVLPVEFMWFNGHAVEGKHLLTWETASETNTLAFEIERSTSQKGFEKIGEVEAKGSPSTYRFDDLIPRNGINYYRLKINDLDGQSNYSKIIALGSKRSQSLSVFPNPVSETLYLEGVSTLDGGAVFNAYGQLVLALANSDIKELAVGGLPPGVYFLQIANQSVRFVKH